MQYASYNISWIADKDKRIIVLIIDSISQQVTRYCLKFIKVYSWRDQNELL